MDSAEQIGACSVPKRHRY